MMVLCDRNERSVVRPFFVGNIGGSGESEGLLDDWVGKNFSLDLFLEELAVCVICS